MDLISFPKKVSAFGHLQICLNAFSLLQICLTMLGELNKNFNPEFTLLPEWNQNTNFMTRKFLIWLCISILFVSLQSVTIYSSEMAPPKYRGMLNLMFQWCVTIGIIIAQLINYGTETNYKHGWRISLAIAAVPAFMILAGGLFLPETPSSLISRNYHEEGRKVALLTICFPYKMWLHPSKVCLNLPIMHVLISQMAS